MRLLPNVYTEAQLHWAADQVPMRNQDSWSSHAAMGFKNGIILKAVWQPLKKVHTNHMTETLNSPVLTQEQWEICVPEALHKKCSFLRAKN